MPRRPKKPAKRFPNVEARLLRGAWRWRARVKIRGRIETEDYRDTQELAYEDVVRIRERGQKRAHALGGLTLEQALDTIQERRERVVDAWTIERELAGRRKFLLACWEPATLLSTIDEREVDWMIGEAIRLKRASSTISTYVQLLQQCFKLEQRQFPPFVIPKQRPPKLDFFTPDELRDYISRMRACKHGDKKDRDIALVCFVAMTGVRCEEFLRLRTKDIDLERRTIAIRSKDKANPRTVSITDALLPHVSKLLEHSQDGRLMTRSGWHSMFGVWKKRLGTTINGRILRRSFITGAAYSGLSHADVRDLAGHTRGTTTDRYMRAISQRQHTTASHVQDFLALPPADEEPQSWAPARARPRRSRGSRSTASGESGRS